MGGRPRVVRGQSEAGKIPKLCFNRQQAIYALGISKTSLYELGKRHPAFAPRKSEEVNLPLYTEAQIHGISKFLTGQIDAATAAERISKIHQHELSALAHLSIKE